MNNFFDCSKISRVILFGLTSPILVIIFSIGNVCHVICVKLQSIIVYCFKPKKLSLKISILSKIYMYHMLNATVYDSTKSFYCTHLYFIVQCILLLEQPDDTARVKGAHSYEFIVRSPVMIPIQHFRQWTVPHHSAQTVTAGLVIDVASSYTYLLVGSSMTIKNLGMGSLNIIHSNRHMTFVNQTMTKV
jgi:hypothetical protein